jgi:hypothetical protein
MTVLSQQLYELSSNAPTDKRARQPRQLAYAVDSLRDALTADVQLRTQGSTSGGNAVVADSAIAVSQRRRDLDMAVAGLIH